MGLHSSTLNSHLSFGLHQEPFHGFQDPHHGGHRDVHHDDHFSFRPYVRYSTYPRYAYSSGSYYNTYTVPVVYTTPTVVVTQPRVIYADPAPVPADGYEVAPETPTDGTSDAPRDESGTRGAPPVLRAPLVETEEAPEVLPPAPNKPG